MAIDRIYMFSIQFKQFISQEMDSGYKDANKLFRGGPCLGPLRLLQYGLILFCSFAYDRPALVGPLILVVQLK